MSRSADILGLEGPLAPNLPGYVPRTSQQDLATQFERVLEDYSVYIAESGTGTGKTFAYLVPVLLSGKKALISTGTKNLQDQLYHRDLPLVRDSLAVPVSVVLLKGRANYLCRHRLQRAEEELSAGSGRSSTELARIRAWTGRTRNGDIAEMNEVPQDSMIWPRVTSTVENCLGSECPDYNECFVNRARREALAADVVVVNHHLFFADLALREEGFGQLLPGVEAVIFDEAHQLPEIASEFFSLAVSGHQLLNLARDTIAEDIKEQSGQTDLRAGAERLEKAVADFRLVFGIEPRRAAWQDAADKTEVHSALEELRSRLIRLLELLETVAARGPGLANCARRASELLDRLYLFSDHPPPDSVAWIETSPRGFVLRLTPLDVSAPFRERVEAGKKAWIFTSATLAIDSRFTHFQSQMGLEQAETGLWPSPFDFEHQALLYLPQGMPEPAASDFTQRVVEKALPVLTASRGRAFLLFTSHRALKLAAEMLAGLLDYPLLIQGTLPPKEMLVRFRAAGNAVLLGTGSFWEGVDVRGEALSCVIIDKLPFATPDDPVLQARAAAMEQTGRSPFMEYQLPNAVIALKQGVGRLIRDASDRGVLMLCDPRVLSKGYGRFFLNSLPPMRRTRDLAEVQRFFLDEEENRSTVPCPESEA